MPISATVFARIAQKNFTVISPGLIKRKYIDHRQDYLSKLDSPERYIQDLPKQYIQGNKILFNQEKYIFTIF
jgi:hypothetical protein